MSIALDYTSRIDPAALKAAGVTTVCRYLSWLPNSKVIGKAEYDELRAAGFRVVLNWEYASTDWMSGAAGAKAHAAEAVRQARALGYPAGAPIPGSADMDMARAQWTSAGKAYATTFKQAIHDGGYAAGVYGPWDVLQWVHDEVGFDMYWQSMSKAYSARRNTVQWPGVHLWQQAGKTVGGVQADWNTIVQEVGAMQLDYGQQGPPTGDKYATDLSRATTGQGVFLADLAGQEMQGHSLYNGVGKSFRTLQLERIEADLADLKAAVAALATGGVDAAALANDVATKIGAAIADAFAAIANKPADE